MKTYAHTFIKRKTHTHTHTHRESDVKFHKKYGKFKTIECHCNDVLEFFSIFLSIFTHNYYQYRDPFFNMSIDLIKRASDSYEKNIPFYMKFHLTFNSIK